MDANFVETVYFGRWKRTRHFKREFFFVVLTGHVWRLGVTCSRIVCSRFDCRLGVSSAGREYELDLPFFDERVDARLVEGAHGIRIRVAGVFFFLDTQRLPPKLQRVKESSDFVRHIVVYPKASPTFDNRFYLLSPRVFAVERGNVFFVTKDYDFYVFPMGVARQKWNDTVCLRLIHHLPKDLVKIVAAYIKVSVEAYETRRKMSEPPRVDVLVRQIVSSAEHLKKLGDLDIQCAELGEMTQAEKEADGLVQKLKYERRELAYMRREFREQEQTVASVSEEAFAADVRAGPFRQRRLAELRAIRRERKEHAAAVRQAKRKYDGVPENKATKPHVLRRSKRLRASSGNAGER